MAHLRHSKKSVKREKPKRTPDPMVEPVAVPEPEAAAPVQDNQEPLTAAAEAILGTFPDRTKTILEETAQMLAIQPWQLVVGLVQKAYDTGEHTAPVLSPEWMMTTGVARVVYQEKVCECGCAMLFTPRWPGQIYATVECGNRAARTARDRARSDLGLVIHKLGEEPEGVAKSTIHPGETPNTPELDVDGTPTTKMVVGSGK